MKTREGRRRRGNNNSNSNSSSLDNIHDDYHNDIPITTTTYNNSNRISSVSPTPLTTSPLKDFTDRVISTIAEIIPTSMNINRIKNSSINHPYANAHTDGDDDVIRSEQHQEEAQQQHGI